MTAADLSLYLGYGLSVAGVYLLAGLGWALLLAGVVLFAAGGLTARRR